MLMQWRWIKVLDPQFHMGDKVSSIVGLYAIYDFLKFLTRRFHFTAL